MATSLARRGGDVAEMSLLQGIEEMNFDTPLNGAPVGDWVQSLAVPYN